MNEGARTGYVTHFNTRRPRQGLKQRVPVPDATDDFASGTRIVAAPCVLGSIMSTRGRLDVRG
jgi:hypothetical protein